MKKLLSLLGIISLTATTASSVVACNNPVTKKKNSEISELKTQIDHLTNEKDMLLNDLTNEKNKIENDLKQRNDGIVDLQKQINNLTNEKTKALEQKNSEISELKTQIDHLTNEKNILVNDLTNEKNKIENDLKQRNDEIVDLQKQINNLTNEKTKALEQKNSKISELKTQIDHLTNEKTEVNALLEEMKTRDFITKPELQLIMNDILKQFTNQLNQKIEERVAGNYVTKNYVDVRFERFQQIVDKINNILKQQADLMLNLAITSAETTTNEKVQEENV